MTVLRPVYLFLVARHWGHELTVLQGGNVCQNASNDWTWFVSIVSFLNKSWLKPVKYHEYGLVSFNAFFSSFSLAESPPRDLQITTYFAHA